MRVEKVKVYTAITGGKNTLLQPLHPDKEVDYICFADSQQQDPGVWQIHTIPDSIISRFTSDLGNVDHTRVAKFFKLQPHTIPQLADADATLWVDGSIKLKMKNISRFMKDMFLGQEKDFVVFANPERKSVAEEVEYCIRNEKDDADILLRQLTSYLGNSFPDSRGLINGSCILRKTKKAEIIRFNDIWWQDILSFSKRDEISFPYLAWLHNFDFGLFPWNSRYDCPLIEVTKHKK